MAPITKAAAPPTLGSHCAWRDATSLSPHTLPVGSILSYRLSLG
jgi:hypothetical protein